MFRILEASHRPGSGASGRGSLQDDSPQLGARLSSLVRRHERVSSSRTVSNLESLPTLTRAKPHANRSAYWRHCGRPARKCLHVLASPAWALADSSPPAPPPTPRGAARCQPQPSFGFFGAGLSALRCFAVTYGQITLWCPAAQARLRPPGRPGPLRASDALIACWPVRTTWADFVDCCARCSTPM